MRAQLSAHPAATPPEFRELTLKGGGERCRKRKCEHKKERITMRSSRNPKVRETPRLSFSLGRHGVHRERNFAIVGHGATHHYLFDQGVIDVLVGENGDFTMHGVLA